MSKEAKTKIIIEVLSLFEISIPSRIRKSLSKVILDYVVREENYTEDDYKKVLLDFKILIEFMERIEELGIDDELGKGLLHE